MGKESNRYLNPLLQQVQPFVAYDDYKFYEKDERSLVKIGRRWFGEQFSFENEQTFTFEFDNVVPGQTATLRVEVAAISESSTSFSVAVNGGAVGSVSMPPISDVVLARGGSMLVDVPITGPEVAVTLTYNNSGILYPVKVF